VLNQGICIEVRYSVARPILDRAVDEVMDEGIHNALSVSNSAEKQTYSFVAVELFRLPHDLGGVVFGSTTVTNLEMNIFLQCTASELNALTRNASTYVCRHHHRQSK
jgi:hypothetical protein